MMATVTITAHYRFWFMPYLHTLVWLCDLMGTEPDYDKLDKIIRKGIYIK